MRNNTKINPEINVNNSCRFFKRYIHLPWYKQLILGYLFILLYLVSFCIFHKVNPDTTISPITLSSFLVALFLGGAGLGYIAYVVCFFIHRKIERDKLMMKERYWKFLIGLVVAIPFTFYAFLLPFMTPENLYNESTDVYLCNQCGGHQSIEENSQKLGWIIYYYFLDPGNQHSAPGSGAKIISATLALLGVFLFNGLLVTTILGMIDRRKEGLRNGRVRYTAKDLPANQFAVVIGANEIASSVIKNLLKPKTDENTLECLSNKNNKYVILQTSSDVQKVRDVLASHLTPAELDKVIIYNALRDSELEIAHLHLEYATEIYILGENTTIDGGETYHDAMNMRCLNIIARVLKKNRNGCDKKDCHVMFEYQTTYSVFQFSDVSADVKSTLFFIPFNRYESWARKALVDCVDYTPLDGKGIKYEDNERVHFVIVGMSKMGIAMGIQALLQLHFPNYTRDRSLKSRITFIDTNADKEMAFFKGRYATLFELARHRYIDANNCNIEQLNTQDECGVESNKNEYRWIDPMKDSACKWKHLSKNGENFLDVEIEFIKGELESAGIRNYLKEISKEELNSKLTIAICLTQTHQAVAAALYMPIEIYSCKNLQQILVYQREAEDIIANLQYMNSPSMRYQKLRPFGMLYGEYMPNELYTLKAKLTNWAYHVIKDNKKWPIDLMQDVEIFEEIKDSWEKTKIAEQYANMNFVDAINQKLRSGLELAYATNLNSNSEDAFAESEHNRWNIDRLLLGYSPCDAESDLQLRVLQKQQKDTSIFKNKLKESPARIHPNICDHKHLSEIDVEAYPYDKELNSYIPTILSLVSDR
jgi:hypothetical protein